MSTPDSSEDKADSVNKDLKSSFGFGGAGAWGSWVSLGVTVSPSNLQSQQPIVVGDSVLSGGKETGIDSHVVFVPVGTQRSVAGSVALRGKELEALRPGFQPLLCAVYLPM